MTTQDGKQWRPKGFSWQYDRKSYEFCPWCGLELLTPQTAQKVIEHGSQ